MLPASLVYCNTINAQVMMADGMISPGRAPILEFIKLADAGRDPKRAERSGGGLVPGRAMRHCDSLTSATGYGFWLFPPIDLQLMWDGEQIFWSYDNAAAWLPLSGAASGAVQLPGFSDRFDEFAPPELRGSSPPFLTALPELGGVQIWTGLMARTRPGWSLNVRLPVNLPSIPGLSAWEGIVETDHWFGPLFTNFRITRTDFPVRLRSHVPFMQVQPIPQIAYSEESLGSVEVRAVSDMDAGHWQGLTDVLIPNEAKLDHQGTYAVRTRKRRLCPHHAAVKNSVLT